MPSDKAGSKVATHVAGFVVQLVISFLNALWVMLGLGVAHDHWPAVPALGYGATLLLVLGISALAGSIHGGLRTKIAED